MKIPKRIYILGNTGSGKSHLAKQLSTLLNIPHFDLDDIYWIKKYTKKLPKNKRKLALKKVISKESWIIEGVYTSWIEAALRKSDLVIWINPPFRIVSWRIFKRYLSQRKNGYPLKDAIKLWKFARLYKKEDLSTGSKSHSLLIKKHKVKYIIVKNKYDIKKLMKSLK